MRAAVPQPTRIERAARDAAAHMPVETEGITRLPWGLCLLIWAAVLLPVWGGAAAAILMVIK